MARSKLCAAIWTAVVAGIVGVVWAGRIQAGPISVPNGSFESPATAFAYPQIDSWQQIPGWNSLQSGVFLNTSLTNSDHIDNCDGNQAAFLFAVPQVAMFQDYDSTDWSNSTPTHAFNVTFEPGKSYDLTVGVIGGGGGMTEGATLQLSLYYRDAASNRVTVAATNIPFTLAGFPTTTHFIDCQAHVPVVGPGDAWAGQHLGVELLSSVGFGYTNGGYWDVDNVRLSSAVAPALVAPAGNTGQFTFTLQSEPGLRFEILAASSLTLPLSNWLSVGIVTNLTGSAPFADTTATSSRRFYQARQVP